MADATGHSMDESIFWAFIKDWWGFGAFLAGAAGAYLTGRERQRYRVDAVGKDVSALKKDVDAVRKELGEIRTIEATEAVASARAITELATDVRYLRKAMDELRDDLRRKADK